MESESYYGIFIPKPKLGMDINHFLYYDRWFDYEQRHALNYQFVYEVQLSNTTDKINQDAEDCFFYAVTSDILGAIKSTKYINFDASAKTDILNDMLEHPAYHDYIDDKTLRNLMNDAVDGILTIWEYSDLDFD